MTLEEARRKLEEATRRKKHTLRVLGVLSVGMGIPQALERDWPMVLFCVGVGTVLWREGRIAS